jgi:integrase
MSRSFYAWIPVRTSNAPGTRTANPYRRTALNTAVNKLLTNLHGVFERARRVYGLASNPVSGVDRQPHRRSGDFNVLSPAEVGALARAAESDQDAAIFTVAVYSGLRMGELIALR